MRVKSDPSLRIFKGAAGLSEFNRDYKTALDMVCGYHAAHALGEELCNGEAKAGGVSAGLHGVKPVEQPSRHNRGETRVQGLKRLLNHLCSFLPQSRRCCILMRFLLCWRKYGSRRWGPVCVLRAYRVCLFPGKCPGPAWRRKMKRGSPLRRGRGQGVPLPPHG